MEAFLSESSGCDSGVPGPGLAHFPDEDAETPRATERPKSSRGPSLMASGAVAGGRSLLLMHDSCGIEADALQSPDRTPGLERPLSAMVTTNQTSGGVT